MTPKEIFDNRIAPRIASPDFADQAEELDAIYQFDVTGEHGGQWVVDLKTCTVKTGEVEDADCSVTITDSDFIEMVEGETSGQELFMMGKLQLGGNMGLALKLETVLADD